jgi:putative flippase GtrA
VTEQVFLKSFSRYTAVGASSTILQYLVLTMLVEIFGVGAKLASTLAFVSGCLLHYLLLYYWAFHATDRHRRVAAKYLLVTGMTFWINLAIFSFFIEGIQLPYLLAQAFATVSVALINFFCNRHFTFH